MPANLEYSAVVTVLEKVSFHSNPKEMQCQNMFKLSHNVLTSNASKVMPKILQASLQQYMNWELLDVQAGFQKGRRTRDQIANIGWIIAKARVQLSSLKTSTSALLTTLKPLTVWIKTNLKILKEVGIPDHLTCLLKNLYASQEVAVRRKKKKRSSS